MHATKAYIVYRCLVYEIIIYTRKQLGHSIRSNKLMNDRNVIFQSDQRFYCNFLTTFHRSFGDCECFVRTFWRTDRNSKRLTNDQRTYVFPWTATCCRIRCLRSTNFSARLIQHSRLVFTIFIPYIYANYKPLTLYASSSFCLY